MWYNEHVPTRDYVCLTRDIQGSKETCFLPDLSVKSLLRWFFISIEASAVWGALKVDSCILLGS